MIMLKELETIRATLAATLDNMYMHAHEVLTIAFYALSQHPEILDRLRAEVLKVINPSRLSPASRTMTSARRA